MPVVLREVREDDVPEFFLQQLDADARRMAAFTALASTDPEAFHRHWMRIIADDGVEKRTILVDDEIAGNIVSFEMFGERNVGYWLAKRFWGRGIATAALRSFLEIATLRPLHARAASDNAGSRRVLEKCGFCFTGTERSFANAREAEIDEATYVLD